MSTILDSSHVFLDVEAATRDEVLGFIADAAAKLGATADAAAVLAGLKEREAAGSTGMKDGFAIPHCKSAAVSDPCVLVCRLAGEVDWQTTDKAPVSCAIALLIPEGELGHEHLSILSKIAVMLMHEDFCETLRSSDSADAVVAAINEGLQD